MVSPPLSSPLSRGSRLLTHALVILLVVGLSATAWAREIQSRVSSEKISTQDVLTFTVEASGDVRSIVPPQANDFEIVARSTQTSMSFVSGHMARTLTASFQLTPKRAGLLKLGPAQVVLNTGRSIDTEEYQIQVSDAGAPRGTTPQLPPSSGMTPPAPSMPPIPAPRGPPPSRSLRSPAAKEFGDYPPLGPIGSDQLITKDDYRFDASQPFILPFVSRKSVVIGEPFLVEYMYYSPVRGLGFDAFDLSEPAYKDAWFKDISEARHASGARVSNVQIAGSIYSAQLVRSYLVVPLKEGDFEVAPISLMVEARSFSRGAKPALTSSPAMDVQVQTVPEEGRPAGSSRSVGRYHFRASVSPEEAQVGDTFQLNLEVFGIGVPSQIRLPEVELPATLRAFAPTETSRSVDSTTGWVESQLRRTISFQATAEGDYIIPPIAFHWFDPWVAQWKTIQSDALTVRVQGVNPNREIEAPEEDDRKPLRVSWIQGLPSGDSIPEGVGVAAQLRKSDEPWRGDPLYALLFLLPIFGTLGVSLFSLLRRQRESSTEARGYLQAGTSALRDLRACQYRDAQSFSMLDRSIREYLRERGVPSAVGATLEELRDTLGETRHQDQIDALLSQLEELQHARFGGSDKAHFQTLRDALILWVQSDQEVSS